MKKLISQGVEITLNELQERACYEIEAFLKQKQYHFFCLNGYAGTGKTTTIKCIIENLHNVVVTAPTHQAVKVIGQLTGCVSKTIHSLLKISPNMDLDEFTQNNVLFDRKKSEYNEPYDVWIIDEASMINEQLLGFIKTTAKDYNIKVIFMGDIYQLPPVKEKISQVFSDPEILQFKLTKIERQSFGNPLGELYDKILFDIESPKDNYEKVSNMVDGAGYSFEYNPQDFTKMISANFELFKHSNTKIMCWTNLKAKQWNLMTRRLIVTDLKYPIQPGEFIISYRTVSEPTNFKINIIENSNEYLVSSIKESEKICEYFENGTKYAMIKGYEVGIENIYTSRYNNIFVVSKESYDVFQRIDSLKAKYANSLKGKERGYAFKLYYEQFRNIFLLLGDIVDQGGNILVKKDIDYGYCITVHKSQGHTFENAFVDENNLDENRVNRERNSLKYVAFSRAKKAAYIYNRIK